MTTTPPSASSSNPTDGPSADTGAAPSPVAGDTGAEPEQPSSLPSRLLKGCGCLTSLVLLAVAVAFVGGGEPASWGSALFGVVILFVIVGTSGLVGFLNRKS